MIKSKKLSIQKNITHGFFNKLGGKSTGQYHSLNCGLGSNDKRQKIYANLKIVKNRIGKSSKKIFLLNQIHSNKFIYINKNSSIKRKIKADAIITDQKKLPIAVLTADCVPILLHERKKNMIAAIHAGWKGAYKEIIRKVLKFMLKKGCNKDFITAAIGPCIGKASYEVGNDFRKKFMKRNQKNKIFFNQKKNIIYFDLPKFVKFQLKSFKIKNVDTINIDTFDEKNNFFSARRSLKLKHADYGRNISIIMIN